MKLKPYQKNILYVLCIVIGGFILFNLAFLLAALVINASINILGVTENAVPHVVGRVLFLLIVCVISLLVFHSRLNDILKATYLTMPLMVALVIIGLSLYQQPKWLVVGIGVGIICAVIFYLHKKKLSWLYFFSVFYVSVVTLCIMLFNIQI